MAQRMGITDWSAHLKRYDVEQHHLAVTVTLRRLAFVCLVLLSILLYVMAGRAERQFGVGTSATVASSTTSTTVKIGVILTSLTPIVVSLTTDGIYTVTGYACVAGDNLFFNSGILSCGPIGVACTHEHNTFTDGRTFTLSGLTTAVVPSACADGSGYGIQLEMVATV